MTVPSRLIPDETNLIMDETNLTLGADDNTISTVDPVTNEIRKYVFTKTLSGTTVTEYLGDKIVTSVDANKATGTLQIKENNNVTEDNINNYIKIADANNTDVQAPNSIDGTPTIPNLGTRNPGEVYLHSEYDSSRNIGALLLGKTTTTKGITRVLVFSKGTKIAIVLLAIASAVPYISVPTKFATVLLGALGVNLAGSTLAAAIDAKYQSKVDYTALRCCVNGRKNFNSYREYTYALFHDNKKGTSSYKLVYSRGNLNTNSFICWSNIRYYATYFNNNIGGLLLD